MCKEVMTVHVGQAGVQASHALWELVCLEHGITSEGVQQEVDDIYMQGYRGEHIEAIFYRTKDERCVPRAILVDLEPTVVDEVRVGSYRNMWNPCNIINQKEDAASNFARGYYTSGKSFLVVIIDRINKELERCDSLSAFEIVHSFAGGTGSGLTALLYETISTLYGKKFRFSLGVFPSPQLSEIMVESYNTVLHTSSTLENEDCVVVFDNESLFKKSINKLNVSQPTFSLMNRLISQMFSSISLSHRYRFFGSQHADVTELLTNLVPYPRIHFPIMSYSPLVSFTEKNHELFTCSRLTNDVFDDDSHVLQCSLNNNKFMSCCMLYRGEISPKPVIDAISKIKASRNINFVDWCPTGFKIGLNTCPPIQIPQCEQAIAENALCMISGNTAIRTCWSVVTRKFDMLMSKRAFVHWYVGEGLEEGEFLDSREDIQTLIRDYEELSLQNMEDNSTDDVKPKISTQKSNPQEKNVMFKNDSNIMSVNHSNVSTISSKMNILFRSQNNQSYYKDKNQYVVKDSKKYVSKRSIKMSRSFSKVRSNQSSSSYSSSNQCQLTKTKGKEFVENTKDALQKTHISKRNRHETKTLEVKDIGRTIAKCLLDDKVIIRNLTYPKKLSAPFHQSQSTKNSEISSSQSYTTSQSEFLGKYELMKNNNKGKSIQNSSSSFKSVGEIQNKVPVNFIRKSKSKLIILDQLLYSADTKKELKVNIFDLEIEEKDAEKKSFSCIDVETDQCLAKEQSVSQTDKTDTYLMEDSRKRNDAYVDMETNMSQNFKVKNLKYYSLESVTCEQTQLKETQKKNDVNVYSL